MLGILCRLSVIRQYRPAVHVRKWTTTRVRRDMNDMMPQNYQEALVVDFVLLFYRLKGRTRIPYRLYLEYTPNEWCGLAL